MKIRGIIWLRSVVDKLLIKHNVTTDEVEAALDGATRIRRLERGHVEDEDLYVAFGRSGSGRYLTIFFIYKTSQEALVISARQSTQREKRAYGRK